MIKESRPATIDDPNKPIIRKGGSILVTDSSFIWPKDGLACPMILYSLKHLLFWPFIKSVGYYGGPLPSVHIEDKEHLTNLIESHLEVDPSLSHANKFITTITTRVIITVLDFGNVINLDNLPDGLISANSTNTKLYISDLIIDFKNKTISYRKD